MNAYFQQVVSFREDGPCGRRLWATVKIAIERHGWGLEVAKPRFDGRRQEMVVDGLPLLSGAQFTVDTGHDRIWPKPLLAKKSHAAADTGFKGGGGVWVWEVATPSQPPNLFEVWGR